MTEERLISGTHRPEDDEQEQSLRPRSLREYIGQSAVKERLTIYIRAALDRRDALDHILLHGPPGLGKTSLACIVAAEMGRNIRITSGPAIERPGDLAAILTNLAAGDVLFIDEIHRLPRTVEEVLYPAMEDYALDILLGKGPSAREYHMPLPKFTLVGATTRAGLLSAPLLDRFGIKEHLGMYANEELAQILRRSAGILHVSADESGIGEIASCSRGTPRIANRILKRVRDYAQVRADGVITRSVAREGLEMLDIDTLGLDRVDRAMLIVMMDKFSGGPVGLDTLAAATGEDAMTIEDVYEPFLMQLGFLMRTPRGRVCTPLAYAHMGRVPPDKGGPQGDAQMAFEV